MFIRVTDQNTNSRIVDHRHLWPTHLAFVHLSSSKLTTVSTLVDYGSLMCFSDGLVPSRRRPVHAHPRHRIDPSWSRRPVRVYLLRLLLARRRTRSFYLLGRGLSTFPSRGRHGMGGRHLSVLGCRLDGVVPCHPRLLGCHWRLLLVRWLQRGSLHHDLPLGARDETKNIGGARLW